MKTKTNKTFITFLCALLLIAVSGGGCDRENQYETEFKENLIDKFFEYKGNHILTINIIT